MPKMDRKAPRISNIRTTNIGQRTATLSWSTDEPATSQVEYGTTTNYEVLSPHDTNLTLLHVIIIGSLAPDREYHWRAISQDAKGNTRRGPDTIFQTLPLVTSPTTQTGSFTIAAATVPQPQPSEAIFGFPRAVRGGKNNSRILAANAIRHTARVGGQVRYVRSNFRNDLSGYGGGDGGTFRIGYQTVNANGLPSGTWVGGTGATKIESPGLRGSSSFDWEIDFAGAGPTLTPGVVYALVLENVHAAPTSNWTSINMPNDWNGPTLAEEGMAYIIGSGSAPYQWTVQSPGDAKDLAPVWDTEYADGSIEGMVGERGSVSPAAESSQLEPTLWGYITSASDCHETWTQRAADGTIAFDAVSFWMWRFSGTTKPVVTVLVNGATVATGTFEGASAAAVDVPMWQRAALSDPVTVEPGDSVDLRLSVTAGEYRMNVMLLRSTTSPTAQRSWPYMSNKAGGLGTQPFRATDSGGAAWSGWLEHSTYMFFVDVGVDI